MLTSESKKIRAQISRYFSSLKKEIKMHCDISDGAGKRYMLPDLYMQVDDVDGAYTYYLWYHENIKHDSGEAIMFLSWCVMFFMRGEKENAHKMYYTLMFENPYLVPHLLGIKYSLHDFWHGTNKCMPEWFEGLDIENRNYLRKDFLLWLGAFYDSIESRRILKEWASLKHAAGAAVGVNERRKLFQEVDLFEKKYV